LRVLEQHLQRPYLAGERFTVADVCVASVLAWIKPMPDLLQDKPRLAAWLQRCLERPAQQQVRALSRKS
jgi:glutathione S-transferase